MNSSQELLPEDRAEFERILDEALHNLPDRPESTSDRPTAEQLRTLALDASTGIAARAADEYRAYVEARRAAGEGVPDASRAGSAGSGQGAGMVAMFAVLAPVLAAVAAVLFLLTGYLLRAVNPSSPAASSLIDAGWVFVALTGGALLLAMAGLLVTAMRDGSAAVRGTPAPSASDEVARAREAWRTALLERGVRPFLQQALTAHDVSEVPAGRDTDAERRMPDLGYSRPDFSSPSESGSPAGPERGTRERRYDSPGYTSPEYDGPGFGGPEHDPT